MLMVGKAVDRKAKKEKKNGKKKFARIEKDIKELKEFKHNLFIVTTVILCLAALIIVNILFYKTNGIREEYDSFGIALKNFVMSLWDIFWYIMIWVLWMAVILFIPFAAIVCAMVLIFDE